MIYEQIVYGTFSCSSLSSSDILTIGSEVLASSLGGSAPSVSISFSSGFFGDIFIYILMSSSFIASSSSLALFKLGYGEFSWMSISIFLSFSP